LRRPYKQRRNDDNFNKSGLTVEVRNGDFNAALRRFKKKWERSGVLKDVKRKAFYEKPSVTKRIAKKQTIRRAVRLAKFNN